MRKNSYFNITLGQEVLALMCVLNVTVLFRLMYRKYSVSSIYSNSSIETKL